GRAPRACCTDGKVAPQAASCTQSRRETCASHMESCNTGAQSHSTGAASRSSG
ncbi:hypothetical protein HAX54_000538, partial [Datura stramonium]|nr:hypothetical protein [Datura stramonium]